MSDRTLGGLLPGGPLLFYDVKTGQYWLEIAGRFLPVDRGNAKLHLRAAGLYAGKMEDGLNPCEKALLAAQLERAVDYAGPVAGHSVGLKSTTSGDRFLVTSSANLDLGKPGKSWRFLEDFLGELLPGEQAVYFLYWLRFARLSLERGEFRPGQAAVFAGPARCGKSFLQWIVTEFLGGRSSDPLQYMLGETPFNAHIAQAEHAMIEDKGGSTDIRVRSRFAAAIRELSVCLDFNLHGKGKIAIKLPTFKRLTISVNDEPERLTIVPPLNADMADKLHLFKCADATKRLSDDFSENQARVRKELAAFREALIRMRVPEPMRDQRMGVRAYHHPDLLAILEEVESETKFMRLLDEIVFPDKDAPHQEWEGTAEQLEAMLYASQARELHRALDRVLYWSGAVGTYLGRLRAKHHTRIQAGKDRGKTVWTIKPPPMKRKG